VTRPCGQKREAAGVYFVEWLCDGKIVERGAIDAKNVAKAIAVAQTLSIEIRSRLIEEEPDSFRLLARDRVFKVRK
jgi:hypothetical protein